jgi:monoamine oxidase
VITEAVFAAEPEDVCALWSAFYVGAAGGLDSLIRTSGGAQQDRGGTQRIALALAGELGDRVVLGAPVTGIEWDAAGVRVVADGTTVRARRAMVAVPPPLAARIRFTPGLPGDRDQLVQRMPMGRVIKINVVYDEPFWRRAGLSGQANSDRRPLGTVFDNTPLDGSPGVLVGFLEGRHAGIGARLDPADRRAQVIDDLTGYFGPQAMNPIAYIERDWTDEEFSRGCYGAFATPGTLTQFGPALRTPVGPLHWAGTETATRWAGYIDGAAESGHRAAREIAASSASRPAGVDT